MYFSSSISLITCFVYFDNFFGYFITFLFTFRYCFILLIIVCASWYIKHISYCLNGMIVFLIMNEIIYFGFFYFFANMAIAFFNISFSSFNFCIFFFIWS